VWKPRRICWVNRTRLCIYFSDHLRGWRESGSISNTLYLCITLKSSGKVDRFVCVIISE
jgi:hypothetical protein